MTYDTKIRHHQHWTRRRKTETTLCAPATNIMFPGSVGLCWYWRERFCHCLWDQLMKIGYDDGWRASCVSAFLWWRVAGDSFEVWWGCVTTIQGHLLQASRAVFTMLTGLEVNPGRRVWEVVAMVWYGWGGGWSVVLLVGCLFDKLCTNSQPKETKREVWPTHFWYLISIGNDFQNVMKYLSKYKVTTHI